MTWAQNARGSSRTSSSIRWTSWPRARSSGPSQEVSKEKEALSAARSASVGGVRGEQARAVVVAEVDQVAVFDGDALGAAGGARGVDDVRGVLGQQGPEAVGVGRVVGGEPVPGHRVQAGEQGVRAGVGEKELLSFGGEFGVQAEQGGARLEDGEHRHHQVAGARQPDGDHVFGARALGDEVVGEPVGAPVQRGEAERGVTGGQGGALRGAGGLCLEQGGEGGVRLGQAVALALAQYAVPLVVAHQRQPVHAPPRVRGDGLQQDAQPGGQAFGGVGVEQPGVVLQVAGESVVALHEVEREVVRGGAHGRGHRFRRQAGQQGRFGAEVVQGDHDLEERGAAGVPFGLEGVHDTLEGHLLVGERVQDGVAHLGEQLPEGHTGADAGTQHQRVDEHADQVVQFGPFASCGDGADGDVLLSRPPGEQRLTGRHERHVEGGVGLPCPFAQPLGERGGRAG